MVNKTKTVLLIFITFVNEYKCRNLDYVYFYYHIIGRFVMIILQVDARVSSMRQEDIEQELQLLGEVLAALDGELISAEVNGDQQSLVAYVCAESELMVSDVFEASYFIAERIVYLGPSPDTHIDFNRPTSRGTWRYHRPRLPLQSASSPNTHLSSL